jgi:hypothetical protein
MSIPNYEPGCMFDSHKGHYIIVEIIRFAEGEGRKLNDRMTNLIDRYESESHDPTYPFERVIEESDKAIEWLNDNRRPDAAYAWGWNDGDFGLYEIEDDDE